MLPADTETFFWSHEAAEPEPANELCDQKGPGKFVFLLIVVGLCLFYILDCQSLPEQEATPLFLPTRLHT